MPTDTTNSSGTSFCTESNSTSASTAAKSPNSTGAARSIGWPEEIPVKGIDGEEYRTCPSCGSDMLELQGDQLNRWGWKIVCPDCDWEIKQAELLDVEQYCGVMEQTKRDLSGAAQIMESTTGFAQ